MTKQANSNRPGEGDFRSRPRSESRPRREGRPSEPGTGRPTFKGPKTPTGPNQNFKEKKSESKEWRKNTFSKDRPNKKNPEAFSETAPKGFESNTTDEKRGVAKSNPFHQRSKGEKRPRKITNTEQDFHKKEFDRRKPRPYSSRKEDSASDPRGKEQKRRAAPRSDGDFARMRKEAKLTEKPNDGLIRLNRYIAQAGICSRRQADEYIQAGLISINDQLVTELGSKVDPQKDVVKFNNEPIRSQKLVYLLLNKPKDYITTAEDPEARKTVLELVQGACQERVVPVGRLDRNTTGVLLLTNDGDLATRLTHPKYQVEKVYQVQLDKNMKPADMEKLLEGFELEDGFSKADEVSYIEAGDKSLVGVEIHSGKNRIVRRMFEHLGYQVLKLDRVVFAGLTKKNLRRGQWRFLNDKEIGFLKMMKPHW